MRPRYLGMLLPTFLFCLFFSPLTLALGQDLGGQTVPAIKRALLNGSTRIQLLDIRPKSEFVHTSYLLEYELFFVDEARVSEFRAGFENAIILQVSGLEERIYAAGESIVFTVEMDYWHEEDFFFLSFEQDGQQQDHRMSLPHNPDRGPTDLSGGSSDDPIGPGDIGNPPDVPYCPPYISPGKQVSNDSQAPDHVETIWEDELIVVDRDAEVRYLEDAVDTATQQPLDDTSDATGPNPWLTAEELERQDGMPRVPLNTVEGIVQIPYTIVEEDDQLLVQVDDDWIIGTLADLQTAAKRSIAFDAVWFPDGTIKWNRGNIDDHIIMQQINHAFDYMAERTPIIFEESNSSDSLKFRSTCSNHYRGRVKFYWSGNALVKQLELSGDAYCRPYPTSYTVVHEIFHVLGFAHVHQRPDRDQHVSLIDSYECTNYFNTFNTGIVGQDVFKNFDYSLIGPWDWNSITRTSSADCYTANDNVSEFAHPIYQNHNQWMSVHDINALYRKYGRALNDIENVTEFGSAVASGDFDDDGLVDTVAIGVRPVSTHNNIIHLYFYRGVATDESEGGPGMKQVPWFRQMIGSTANLDDRLVLTTGDLNGDDIPEVIVGHPNHPITGGRVGIAVVNTPTRFGDTAPWGANSLQQFRWLDRGHFGLPYGDYRLGEALATGNLSSDHHEDLLIGMPLAEDSNNGLKRGGAVLHMRGDDINQTQIVWNRGCEYARFGHAISTIPELIEVDGARRDCMVVGAPEDAGYGAIHVFGPSVDASNALIQPSTLKTIRHNVADADYGFAVAGFTTREISNFEGEFYVAVGAPKLPYQDISSGSIYIHRFNRYGKQLGTLRFTGNPEHTSDLDRYGSALAVNQAVIGNLRQKISTHIAIGAPNARYQGQRTGKVYILQPWQHPADQNYTGSMRVYAGSAYSQLGSSLANVLPAKDTPVKGGFLIGAPNTHVPEGNQTFIPGAIKTLLNTNTTSDWVIAHQWWSVNTTGDLLSDNL